MTKKDNQVVILLLTCKNRPEAKKICRTLLEKKLIVCSKLMSVSSSYLWKKKIESSSEMLVLMESVDQKFSEIESTIASLHSYTTFTLFAVPSLMTTSSVQQWMEEELS